jgi:hypothetical protein
VKNQGETPATVVEEEEAIIIEVGSEEEVEDTKEEDNDEEYEIELRRERLMNGRAVPAYLLKITSSGELVQPKELAAGNQLQLEAIELNQHGILFYPNRLSRSSQPRDIYAILTDEDLRKEAQQFARYAIPSPP